MNRNGAPIRIKPSQELAFAFAVFVSAFMVTHLVQFPGSLAHFKQVTDGQKILDMAPSFSVNDVYLRLEAMGDAGREAYRQLIFTIDFIFPVVFLYFLRTWVRFFSPRIWIFPWIYFIFDLGENVAALALLSEYPNKLSAVAAVIGWLTTAKRSGMVLAIFLPPLIYLYSRSHLRRSLVSRFR